jgi:hypothetical protein
MENQMHQWLTDRDNTFAHLAESINNDTKHELHAAQVSDGDAKARYQASTFNPMMVTMMK